MSSTWYFIGFGSRVKVLSNGNFVANLRHNERRRRKLLIMLPSPGLGDAALDDWSLSCILAGPMLVVRSFVESGHDNGQFYIELIKSIYVWTYKEEFIAN